MRRKRRIIYCRRKSFMSITFILDSSCASSMSGRLTSSYSQHIMNGRTVSFSSRRWPRSCTSCWTNSKTSPLAKSLSWTCNLLDTHLSYCGFDSCILNSSSSWLTWVLHSRESLSFISRRSINLWGLVYRQKLRWRLRSCIVVWGCALFRRMLGSRGLALLDNPLLSLL